MVADNNSTMSGNKVIVRHLPRDALVTVGTTTTILSPELTTQIRHALIITNASSSGQVITLGIEKDATINQGIILQPGAIYHEVIDEKFYPTNGQITAISSASGATVSIHERIGDII